MYLKICQVVLHDHSEYGIWILHFTLWTCGFDFSEFGFYILLCGGVLMSLSVNIQRLRGSQGKSDAILGKEIKREEGKLVAGGVFSLYYHLAVLYYRSRWDWSGI